MHNGVFVARNPDNCGVDITTIDGRVSESFHLCCNEELKSKIALLSQSTLDQPPTKRARYSVNDVAAQQTTGKVASLSELPHLIFFKPSTRLLEDAVMITAEEVGGR